MVLRCISCDRQISNSEGATIFKCPRCGTLIVRCAECRAKGNPWKCPKCGFEGP